MIYTLTLNPSLDVDLVVDELKADDSNRVQEHREYPGGKGLNVSRVVKELGGRTMALVVFGGHTGDQIARLLRETEIPFESLDVGHETRTNVIVTCRAKKTVTRINQRGEELTDRAIRVLFDKLDLLDLRHVSYLVLGGSLPGNTPKDLYTRILKRLNKKGDACRILLDADGQTLTEALQARPAMIKPNTHEAARALGRSIESEAEAIEAAKEFRERGVETVLLTRGREGVIAATPDGIFRAIPPEVDSVSAVGSGDSFIGGYLSSLSLGLDTTAALKRACAAGTAATLTPGTELCHASDVHRLASDVVVEKLEDAS